MHKNRRACAVELRKKGKSYSEIKKVVRASSSTLSLWLRDVQLSGEMQARLAMKKRLGQGKGALARRNQRISSTKKYEKDGSSRAGTLSKRERFLLGVALYWAEGSKEKQSRPGSGFGFANMDAAMIVFMLDWLQTHVDVKPYDIRIELYLHEGDDVGRCVQYWNDCFKKYSVRITAVYTKKMYAKSRTKVARDREYYGMAKIRVNKSSSLVRMISGAVSAIIA